ncbi:hypothetical protein TNCV_995931 [Trichonephila clavipes]|nr:hypothetical protein TNCV_995931 [Trichonephila clavipes]
MTTLEMENPTTAMNHGTENLPELTAAEILTETNPNGTAMDQTLPLSRPGSPQHSICLRKRQCVTLIDYYTLAVTPMKLSLKNLLEKESQ